MINAVAEFFMSWGMPGMVVWTLVKIAVLVLPLTLLVALMVLLERRVIGMMQSRWGPLRVGPYGILQ
ncbi:MAG: NADH-quinone oxidoreductase subunit H, partial [Burkholderiales bacterium]|nr:NADH-quinone oxidoreductase subunit H [Burkholderiales bacterium]